MEQVGFCSEDTDKIFIQRKFQPHSQVNKPGDKCRKYYSESLWNRKDKITLEQT